MLLPKIPSGILPDLHLQIALGSPAGAVWYSPTLQDMIQIQFWPSQELCVQAIELSLGEGSV